MHRGSKATAGFSLVEAVVAVSITAFVFAGSIGVIRMYLNSSRHTAELTAATLIAQEGIEVSRLLRDTSYAASLATYASTTTYYVYWNGTAWQATATMQPNISGVYHRTLVFSSVYRNATDDIATSGTLDPNTKKVTVTVAWSQNGATSSTALSAYLSNLFND